MQAQDHLTEINLDDLVSSFGLQPGSLAARLVRLVFHAPAAKFARMILEFDNRIAQDSLPGSAGQMLDRFSQSLQVRGLENLPDGGPVLFLANHPGMVDTLAIFSAIRRDDLNIIALDRPFLVSLPNTTRHLFFVSDDSSQRMKAIRQASTHLRAGGALLTFPAGHIEPDPNVYPGARESLTDWTDSAGVFLRFAPGTRIIPVMVSGVLWEKAVKFPLTRLKAEREEREKLGASLQLLAHLLFDARPLTIQVDFGKPITSEQIGSTDLPAVHAAVLAGMRALIDRSWPE